MTARDSAKRLIAAELRLLRKTPGRLDVAKLTAARALTMAFGGNDAKIALERFTDLSVEHSDRDIDAAMASIGWGVHAYSSLDRLSEFSERHLVDPRTVRRWSDVGIQKLAQLIVGSAAWDQPLARLILTVDEDGIQVAVELTVPPHLRMAAPELLANNEPIRLRIDPIEVSDEVQSYRSGLERLSAATNPPARFRLGWGGEKIPVYEAVTHGSREVYFNARLVFEELVVSVLNWPAAKRASDH